MLGMVRALLRAAEPSGLASRAPARREFASASRSAPAAAARLDSSVSAPRGVRNASSRGDGAFAPVEEVVRVVRGTTQTSRRRVAPATSAARASCVSVGGDVRGARWGRCEVASGQSCWTRGQRRSFGVSVANAVGSDAGPGSETRSGASADGSSAATARTSLGVSSPASSPEAEADAASALYPPTVSAYVHLPFCRNKCRYCDFPVVALGVRASAPLGSQAASGTESVAVAEIRRYVDEVIAEIEATPVSNAVPLSTVSFGGGTPSLVPPAELRRIVEALARRFGLSPECEIGMEADPGTFGRSELDAYVDLAGVTHFSLGVQALRNDVLQACGRTHSGEQALAAIDMVRQRYEVDRAAKEAGAAQEGRRGGETEPVEGAEDLRSSAASDAEGLSGSPSVSESAPLEPRASGAAAAASAPPPPPTPTSPRASSVPIRGLRSWSVDLLSGLPHSTPEDLVRALETVLAASPPHLSCYDLQIEPRTPFGRSLTPGAHPLPSDDDAARSLEAADALLRKRGYEHYEISNFALPQHQCAHNAACWAGNGYYGFGMGAASYVRGVRETRPKTLLGYRRRLRALGIVGPALEEEPRSSLSRRRKAAASAAGEVPDVQQVSGAQQVPDVQQVSDEQLVPDVQEASGVQETSSAQEVPTLERNDAGSQAATSSSSASSPSPSSSPTPLSARQLHPNNLPHPLPDDARRQTLDAFMLGLRTARGVRFDALREPVRQHVHLEALEEALRPLEERGLVSLDRDPATRRLAGVRPTLPAGYLFSNDVVAAAFDALESGWEEHDAHLTVGLGIPPDEEEVDTDNQSLVWGATTR